MEKFDRCSSKYLKEARYIEDLVYDLVNYGIYVGLTEQLCRFMAFHRGGEWDSEDFRRAEDLVIAVAKELEAGGLKLNQLNELEELKSVAVEELQNSLLLTLSKEEEIGEKYKQIESVRVNQNRTPSKKARSSDLSYVDYVLQELTTTGYYSSLVEMTAIMMAGPRRRRFAGNYKQLAETLIKDMVRDLEAAGVPLAQDRLIEARLGAVSRSYRASAGNRSHVGIVIDKYSASEVARLEAVRKIRRRRHARASLC